MAEYVAGVTYSALENAMVKLAPTCERCGEPKTHICLERCCSDAPLFCNGCEAVCHFCHRTNKLEMVFFNRKSITNPDGYVQKSLRGVLASIKQAKTTSELLIAHNLELIDLYDRNTREINHLLEES